MYQNRNKGLDVFGLYLSGYKQEFYLREISKRTGLPLRTTQICVAELEKEKMLRSATRGKNKYFRLNLDTVVTKLHLLHAEIQRTLFFVSKFPLIKTFLKEMRTNATIVVFGSFAKFKADKNSDFDILVVSDEKSKLPMHLLPYKVHEITLSEQAFVDALEKQEVLIKEIEENHVILNNHSFYVNAMWSYYGK